jgi:hypothetical protein
VRKYNNVELADDDRYGLLCHYCLPFAAVGDRPASVASNFGPGPFAFLIFIIIIMTAGPLSNISGRTVTNLSLSLSRSLSFELMMSGGAFDNWLASTIVHSRVPSLLVCRSVGQARSTRDTFRMTGLDGWLGRPNNKKPKQIRWYGRSVHALLFVLCSNWLFIMGNKMRFEWQNFDGERDGGSRQTKTGAERG